MPNNATAVFTALEDFLDKERQAILTGSLKDMERIVREKERLLDKGGLPLHDHKTLNQIRRKIERNQHLLAAAIRGVRTVTARLDVLRNGPGELNTYDKSGQRTTLGHHKSNLHRRA